MAENSSKTKIDVFIKDEGYGDVKFLTDKAKEWAHQNKVSNSLHAFGKTFCGKEVWYPENRKGLYKHGTVLSDLKGLIEDMEDAELIVESEIPREIL